MLTHFEIEKRIKKLQAQLKCLSCRNCVELSECEDGQVPTWDDELQMWICGDVATGDSHDPVTLNADTPTQDSANLVGQELQLVPATDTTYGVIKLEDIVVHDEVTLNADTPTQDSLNLAGQEIQVNPATNTEYGVVKLEDLSIHDPVTLNADQATQDAANLSGQELQLVPAGPTTYGVVKLEDLFDTSDHVNTFADLPDPTLHQDETWIVLNSTGTKYWSWLAGGTWKPKGFYYSNGVSWDWIGDVPYQATQIDVDAGIIVDQFVSPATLAAATTVSHPGHTHTSIDVTDFTEAAQDATGAMVDSSLVYVDGTPLLQRAALTGAITASAGSNATSLGSFTKAQLDTAVSDGNVLYVGDVTQYTDELAQDAVGTILTDSTTIDFTYNDGLNTITADVKTGSIGPTELASTSVTPGSYTNTDLTVDADGRITAASNGSGGGLTFQQVFAVSTLRL